MAKNVEHVSHIKSKLKTNGLPQLPSPDKLVDGEIAINYAEGVETISIKNESGSIVTFSSDNYYTEKKLGSGFTNNDATVTEAIDDLEYMVVNNEEAIAAALNDLNGRKLDASAYTPVDTSLYYKKTETSGATEIQTALNSKADKTVVDGISRQSKTIAAALNDLNDRKLDASAYTPTDLSNYYTKGETSGKTEISNALDGKVNTATYTGHTADTSLHFSGNEKINLDALATNIESISGITSNDIANWNAAARVDMTKYYQKTETSGSTELSTAFSNKADSSALTTHISDATIHITFAERTAWNAKADMSDIPSVNGYADSVQYNSATKKVEFYHGTTAGTKVFEYDASPFLIDGMVQNVEIKNVTSGSSQVTCLVVKFNTDAGKQDINIPISQIFDANNYYTTAQTSGATELQTAFNGKTDTATTTALNNVVATHTANTNIHLTTTEKGQLHTHSNKTALDSITSNVGTMAYENASSYSSATQVSKALNSKADKTAVDDLSGQSETVAAALNDLNGRKLDASAYTPVDTSLYYKKTETSGATEIQTALSNKADKTVVDGISRQSKTIAAALNDLNDRKLDVSAYTPTDLSNYYTKNETSGKTEIQTALNSKVDTTAFTNHTSSSVHMTTTEKTNLDSLATNIAAISGITATKVSNWDDANTKKHTHSNKTALDSITSNVGTMAYENASSYSSATQVSKALNSKADKTVVDDLSRQSKTIADALNDLNTKKLDTTAYTPVDTSLYYKKTETDSKIAEAVSGKVNTSDFNTYSGNVDTAIGSKAAQSDLNTLSRTVTRHTADTSIHVTSTEKENLDSLATNIAAISGVTSTKISNWDNAVTNLGGFKLVEITQSDYDNLPTPRDSKTLYIIRN